MIHAVAIRLLVGPFVWAHQRERQNIITKSIRYIWRKL